jgi:hypothetical protein
MFSCRECVCSSARLECQLSFQLRFWQARVYRIATVKVTTYRSKPENEPTNSGKQMQDATEVCDAGRLRLKME